MTAADAQHFKESSRMSNIDTITAAIAGLSAADRTALLAKVSGAAIHAESERRIKRALNGLAPSENHGLIIDRLASEGVVRTLPADTSYSASAVDAVAAASAVTNNDKPLAERIQAGASNPKKKEATRFALNLLKRLQIPLEACESRATLDAALKEKSLDERFQCKSALAFANILT
jgi:hypothetical protein